MRRETYKIKLQAFMCALGDRVGGGGVTYLTGEATAVWHNWRPMTIDIKPDLRAPLAFTCRLADAEEVKNENTHEPR